MKNKYAVMLFVAALFTVLPGRARAESTVSEPPMGSSPSAAERVQGWAFDQMVAWAPPGHSFYPDAKEEVQASEIRYREIVRDAMSVAYDPSEPPLFVNRRWANGKMEVSDDPIGRAKTLAVMLAIARSESGGYRRDVDFNIGNKARGDGGKSWCIMQIQLSKPNSDGRTSTRIALKGDQYEYVYTKDKGFGGEDLIANRKACFRVALHMARESFRACAGLPVEDRLSVYAGGNCEDGRPQSRVRVGNAIRWLAAKAPPSDDQAVLSSFPFGKMASIL